jgi:hypothetical protein
MNNKNVFYLTPLFGGQATDDCPDEVNKVEKSVVDDGVFSSVARFASSTNIAMALRMKKTAMKDFLRDFGVVAAKGGSHIKRVVKLSHPAINVIKTDYQRLELIPHPKVFHRRILGH